MTYFPGAPLYCGHAGSDVIGCRRPTGGVFVCMLQTRVTLTAFPIATPRGRSSKFPRKGTYFSQHQLRAHKVSRFFTCEFSSLKTRSKRIIWISELSTREQLQSDHSNSWMNRLLRFAKRFNRFIEKNQFVHESDTASASRSTWCIIRSNDMFYEM